METNDTYGNVLPKPQSQNQANAYARNTERLKQSIRDSVFTPIVGTEPSVLGRESTLHWRAMSQEMNRLLTRLQGWEQAWLRALMEARKIPVKPVTQEVQKSLDKSTPGELDRFRLEIVKLAGIANRGFSRGLLRSSLSSAVDYIQVVDEYTDDVELQLIVTSLAGLHLLSTQERREQQSNDEALWEGVCDNLIYMTWSFMGGRAPRDTREPFPGLSNEVRNWGCANQLLSQLEKLSQSQGSHVQQHEHRLSVNQLEWLADLVFHTFSFASRFHPTDDEISYRASLTVSNGACIRRADAVTALERGGPDSEERISNWLKACYSDKDAISKESTAFYRGIASILKRQSMRGKDGTRRVEPVAYSLNFDLGIENALQDEGVQTYFVLVPVKVRMSGSSPSERSAWLLGEFDRDRDYQPPTWSWASNRDIMFSGPEEHQVLKGPIVVKLHGSPLHRLPVIVDEETYRKKTAAKKSVTLDDCIPAVQFVNSWPLSIDHLLVLSERAYLYGVLLSLGMRGYFDEILNEREGRELYFLGLSTSEWNTRLRISDVVVPRRSIPPSRFMAAISGEFDDYQSSVLASLGISRWYGDLGDVGRDLLRFAPSTLRCW